MKTDYKILLIDEPEHAQPISQLLTANGHLCNIASTKEEANTKITTWKPDLIVLNIFFLKFPSIDFLKKLKALPGAQNLQVLVTGYDENLKYFLGADKKIDALFKKPLDLENMRKFLRAHIKHDVKNPASILVIDNDTDSLEVFRRFLVTENYKPTIVETIADACEYLKHETPDAIIVSPLLNDGLGSEFVINNLKADGSQYANIPVAVISAFDFENPVQSGYITEYPELILPKADNNALLTQINALIKALADKQAVKHKVFIADDQTMLLALMKEMLTQSGFDVEVAEDGKETFEKIRHYNPDIIVLDYNLPYKNGFVLASELKADPLYAHIPIIILTALPDKQLKLRGLSLDIDDYLIKPVDSDELVARIRMVLKRTKRVLDANPLTHLPGNPSIQAYLEREIHLQNDFAVLYVDLNQFKAYNDVYGFEAGDKVIKATANILINQAKAEGKNSFLGHIGGDDFILVVNYNSAETIAGKILKDFDAIAPSFYSEEDRKLGYIIAEDRQGNEKKFPMVSISIGIVHNHEKTLKSFTQISEFGSELKHAAKMNPGSSYVIDRRSHDE